MVYSENNPEKRAALLLRFYKLAKKYRPMTRQEADVRAQSGHSNFPFTAITGNVPLNSRSRKDSDEMTNINLQLRR